MRLPFWGDTYRIALQILHCIIRMARGERQKLCVIMWSADYAFMNLRMSQILPGIQWHKWIPDWHVTVLLLAVHHFHWGGVETWHKASETWRYMIVFSSDTCYNLNSRYPIRCKSGWAGRARGSLTTLIKFEEFSILLSAAQLRQDLDIV